MKFLSPTGEDKSQLPLSMKPVGPNVNADTALQVCPDVAHSCIEHIKLTCVALVQSLVSALQTVVQGVSITGQTGSKSALEKNAGVFVNPEQPLIQVFYYYAQLEWAPRLNGKSSTRR